MSLMKIFGSTGQIPCSKVVHTLASYGHMMQGCGYTGLLQNITKVQQYHSCSLDQLRKTFICVHLSTWLEVADAFCVYTLEQKHALQNCHQYIHCVRIQDLQYSIYRTMFQFVLRAYQSCISCTPSFSSSDTSPMNFKVFHFPALQAS